MTETLPHTPQTLTASLTLDGAAKAIELYKKAFGAKEVYRMATPEGDKIMHACLTIGNSQLFLSDTNLKMGCPASTTNFYVYLPDVDAAFKQAKQAGLNELFAPQDMFWGDRTGTVRDNFGITWTLATHVRDVSPEEMEEGRKQFMKAA